MTQHILVTGGAGYIGAHVCKALSKAGYIPVTYDSLEFGCKESVLWGPLEQGQLQDSVRLHEVFSKYPIDGVIHMAALVDVGESVKDPLKYYENNISGTIALLQAMDIGRCSKIVFSSSAAVYGIPTIIPIKEDTEKNPINPYGYSKLAVEYILERLAIERDISSISLRYFNASGADFDGEIGERKKNPSHLIPSILKAALLKKSVSVFGTDYETPDGSCIRDYIHVVDLADAHVKALAYLEEKPAAIALNLGSGQGISVLEVIKEVEKVTGMKVAWTAKGRRKGDPPVLLAESNKAQEVLNWYPRCSTLGEIIISAFQWQKKLLNEGEIC